MIRPIFVVFTLLTLVCGVVYPALVTAVSQAAFPYRANGSLLYRDGAVVGSELVGQTFDEPRYFHGRPSATSKPYDGAASSGSNLGPLNPGLTEGVSARIAAMALAEGQRVPVDLVTASGSGLDPHISPASAEFQVERVATARELSDDVVRELVHRHTQQPLYGLFGAPTVNVLTLNLDLDALPR